VKRVLVADDSETILLLLETRLRMAGYDVDTAADGQQVLDALAGSPENGSPHLVVLDAMMPRKSGLEVLREIRGAGDRTPVLMVSAHREHHDLKEAMASGADGCFTKPLDWDALLARIEELV
jgi:two-component system, OmpR family, response regulator MprA